MNLEDVPAARPCKKKNGTSSVISYVLVQVQKDNTNQTGSIEIVGYITMLSQDCKARRRLPIKGKRPLDYLVFTGLANQMEVADKEVKVKATCMYTHSANNDPKKIPRCSGVSRDLDSISHCTLTGSQ